MAILRALLPLFLLAVGMPAVPAPGEYQVKAVFLFNFAQFVEWPQNSFAAADAPFSICVLGNDPFGSQLEAAVQGELVAGHPFVVKRYRQAQEVENCHILYIGTVGLAQLDSTLAALGARAILTVSDLDGAAERGAIIQFSQESKRLRLRINVGAAKSAGLTLSSKLLRPAEIVGQREG